MAKFITARKTASELEDLIKSAGEKLILISPYLKLSRDIRELLDFRTKNGKTTTIIFRKHELIPDELNFFRSLCHVELFYNEDLHAKCYLSDEKMIITSLNLYEYSMNNNKEMGVLIDKNDPADFQIYADALNEVNFIRTGSQRFEFDAQTVANKTAEPSKNGKSVGRKKTNGFCIRTGVEIPFNVEKPFSLEAYKIWSEYSDPTYPEKFCHFSGELSKGETSYSKPILKKNWNTAKEIFNL